SVALWFRAKGDRLHRGRHNEQRQEHGRSHRADTTVSGGPTSTRKASKLPRGLPLSTPNFRRSAPLRSPSGPLPLTPCQQTRALYYVLPIQGPSHTTPRSSKLASARWPPENSAARIPFATVRLRQRVTKGAGSRTKGLLMAYKLLYMAQARWRRLDSAHL